MKEEYFMGIDPALKNTAYVMIDSNKNIITKNTIITQSDSEYVYLSSEQRILDIFKQLKFISNIVNLKYTYIEDIGYMSKDTKLFERCGLLYMIRCYLFEKNINFKMIPPKTLKKRITNNGNSDKFKMYNSVKEKWNIELENDHLVDAFGLSILALEDFNNDNCKIRSSYS